MVVSIVSEKGYVQSRFVCFPAGVSWNMEVRTEYHELENEEENYSEYGLYLTSSDGMDLLVFHSQEVESIIYDLDLSDDEVEWLFDYMVDELAIDLAEAMNDKKMILDMGYVLDRCVEEWEGHMKCLRKKKRVEQIQNAETGR